MNQSTVCVPKARELPEGFVYIDELIEDCIIDAKYAGTDNFMGRPADGYEQPLVVMTKEAAETELVNHPEVQKILAGKTVMKVIFVPGRLVNFIAK